MAATATHRPTRTHAEMKGYLDAFPGHLSVSTGEALAWVRSLLGYRRGYHRAADRRPRAVGFAGVGGSAFAGDVVRALMLGRASIPFEVIRDYRLPAWIGPDALLIASSYSGDTEETLAAYDEAIAREVPTWVITSGGELQARADASGAPVFRLPQGLPPRAALGHSLPPALLGVGLLAELDTDELAREIQAVAERLMGWGAAGNGDRDKQARELAERLATGIPVFYAAAGLYEPAAVRWRSQLAENAKMLSFHHLLPEMNHNEIVGWQENAELLRRGRAVFLTGSHEHPRVMRRIEITAELISGVAGGVEVVRPRRGTPLEELLGLVLLGDYVSLYAALVHGVEPLPVDRIAHLKSALQTPAPR
jgi:glucose/mannose-6-phosphate isomerase